MEAAASSHSLMKAKSTTSVLRPALGSAGVRRNWTTRASRSRGTGAEVQPNTDLVIVCFVCLFWVVFSVYGRLDLIPYNIRTFCSQE